MGGGGSPDSSPALRLGAPIAAEDAEERDEGAELVEGGPGGRLVRTGVEVDPEDVLPGAAAEGARLDHRHVHAVRREDGEDPVERPGLVGDRDGRPLGSGVYLAVVEGTGGRRTIKFAVQR